ncbi:MULTISPECIES: hypothetical protein [unclassified Pseudoalteromonas]|uniref:hypothetical protein n=1 Tax=Pseudoalteromonas TaxID=53246 RepID=UPI0010214BF2|nr:MULTISPECIES: hypothetical protein [unclassified Pseudoalteromonas]QWV06124.1 hypothetical protein KQ246_06860 [Pseudoalteromonas shioyasakiensis]RZD22569.1 hypothetical protein EVU92_11145 [Pseudoalteromonas sp. MEBiC 03485]
MKISMLSIMTLCTALSSGAYANTCTGELYGINSGRGDLGIVFSLNEQDQSAAIHSKAKFSSAAMAFDSTRNRLYYVSAPRPLTYQLDPGSLNLTDEELKGLPIKGNKFKYTKLAYVDMATGEHVEVGRSSPMTRLAYDPERDVMYGSKGSKFYIIYPDSGETQYVGEMTGYGSSSDILRGDIVIKDSKIYLISSKSIFSLDLSTLQLTRISNHGLVTVTGAAVDQNGELLISREVINDQGHFNLTKLYKASIETGNTCEVGSFPVRVNDLAMDTIKPVACYNKKYTCSTEPESIVITSIDQNRQATWQGYTLNGLLMLWALEKLTSTDNFGENGVVRKPLSINHDFAAANSITEEALNNYNTDIFFIGSFRLSNFTDAELDEAYNWSLKKGNVAIIAGDADYPEEKIYTRWGYKVTAEGYIDGPSMPNPAGESTKAQQRMFAGPFGEVIEFYQSGTARGYFSEMPAGAQVLAVNQQGLPTIVKDPATGDIILADSGMLTIQYKLENITQGPKVTSMADRLLMNLFNYASEID